MNPLSVAFKGKGLKQLTRRVQAITSRYGLTSRKMSRALDHYLSILDSYNCSATFPVTASAVQRSKGVIEAVKNNRVEFAIHGYCHVDHSLLPGAKQHQDLTLSRRLFAERNIPANGFRCPYLRANEETFEALRKAGFCYDSSQSLAWDVLNGNDSDVYQRALEFYGAQSAKDYPALPRVDNGLVEIPYCLPDDEALWDRLNFKDDAARSQPWLDILAETHQRGELFCLGLHPERIYQLEQPLRAVLEHARQLQPPVWIARLDEIAAWWQKRSAIAPEITQTPAGWRVRVEDLAGLTFQTRGLIVHNPLSPWESGWSQVQAAEIEVDCPNRPWIGTSPRTDPTLVDFLRQQGYIVEETENPASYSIFLDLSSFGRDSERRILNQIGASVSPLIRMGRWYSGAKSALSVTGDIDALTIWDYLLRFVGL